MRTIVTAPARVPSTLSREIAVQGGRQVYCQSSMTTFASIRSSKHCFPRHSCREFPLKLSFAPFCHGLPGSMSDVSITVRHLSGCPFAHPSNTKSYAQTGFAPLDGQARGRFVAARFLGRRGGT